VSVREENFIFGVINFNSRLFLSLYKQICRCFYTPNINKDGEAPAVDYCPPSQKHKIEKHHESIKASWIEPKFSDNVKVTETTQTNVSFILIPPMFASLTKAYSPNENLIKFFFLLSIFLFHARVKHKNGKKKTKNSLSSIYLYV
jgi:hypothetical protein